MSSLTFTTTNKPYIAIVLGVDDTILLTVIQESTKNVIKNVKFTTVKEMLQTLSTYKSMLKIVLLCVSMAQTSEYKNSYFLSKAIRDFFSLHSIPQYFCSVEYSSATKILVAANFTPSISDEILCATIGIDELTLTFYRFTVDGYEMCKNLILENQGLEAAANFFVGNTKDFDGKKLFLCSTDDDNVFLDDFANLLRSKYHYGDKFIIVEENDFISFFEMAKWFFHQSYVKFHILPHLPKPVEIYGITGDCRKKLISVESGELIPFTKSITFNKSVLQCLMQKCYLDLNLHLETLQLDSKCHQRKLTFSCENECFPELKVEPIILPEIKDLPEKLDRIVDLKIPVIGFFNNSSVICVHQNDGYKFLDAWDGMYGTELFISFEKSKPKLGMKAITADETKMVSVVYDLVKIMSMPADKISVNESWKFGFTKNAENPVLIQFVNFDGTKSAASPAFLMALLLKEKIKLIKTEMKMEEKPKEIGFCFFDKFAEAEKKLVETGIENACELLKISCKFI